MFAAVMHSAMRPMKSMSARSRAVRLTNHNAFIDRLKLAKQKAIDGRGADRGRIEGVLVRPLDERPGRRYPLVGASHGDGQRDSGRLEYWGDSPAEVLAARGFIASP
jgi:dipeptidyl aminopeptidase/acylaminoacyl peptidase